MTEKEKMLAGELYLAFDLELVEDRKKAKLQIFELNQLSPLEEEKQKEIIRNLFGKTAKNFLIELPFRCDYGYNIHVGKNFYSNYNCTILDCAKVTIGNNVLFAPNVSIFTAGHPIDPEKRNKCIEYAFPVTIGNNVWVGGNVVINPGVTIGDNVVIGSGSVVTKDIPSNTIAFGNPCKVHRKLNDEDKIFYFKNLKY